LAVKSKPFTPQAPNNRSKPRAAKYRSPYKWYFLLALALTLVLAALFLILKFPVYQAYIAGVNLVTFGYYGYDKIQAKRGAGRVPELVLHFLALAGGAAGGIAGQWLFHHKLRKPLFHIILWLSLLGHLLVFVIFQQTLLMVHLF
jgi:uncharacterized membrane protein YsdA (DUF1294 family)